MYVERIPKSMQAQRLEELPGRCDKTILMLALLLASFGLVMVTSSSIAIAEAEGARPFYFVLRHLAFLAFGGALATFIVFTPLHYFDRYSRAFLFAGFLLLAAVLVPGLGRRINGAARWLNLGIIGFQVVEIVKLMLIVYLASYLVRFSHQVKTSLMGTVKPLGIVVLLVGMLLLQPDFGSATLLVVIAAGMVWLSGARVRDLLGLGALGMPVMALAALAEPYRVKRLTSFLNPWADPFNDGFQLSQALIAIGRGEWFGVGLGASIQKLFYLPEAHTDFILAVIGEELGFFGILLVIVLFAGLCGRIMRLGKRAMGLGLGFGAYCAFGVALWLGVQALISIGVNLGVLPTKGLTLPLISSGGSSVLMTCAAIGLVLRVSCEVSKVEQSQAMIDKSSPFKEAFP